jgi:hypothetical protein
MNALNTFSSKELITRFIKDFGISNNNMAADLYEWIGDAIQGIGYGANVEIKTEKVCIENHRGNFPCGLLNIIGVMYKNYRLPLGSDNSLYGIVDWSKNSNTTASNTDLVKLQKLIDQLAVQEEDYNDYILSGGLPSDAQAIKLKGYITTTTTQISTITATISLSKITNRFNLEYYNANTDGIITSFATGEVTLVYSSFPFDREGFPYLIDTFKYKEAVTWYCMYRAILRGYEHKTITDFRFALEMWEKYRYQAMNEAKMFSQDEAEQFKNMWTNAKFNAESWQNFFIHGEQPKGLIK